ncbi:Soluble cytochrome O [Thalassovita gelatinovora]|uniref:Soluble cytochrome O n=1 Tax=Thalassovita gelatinovora TaxID=53501 RepID=A0A0P1FK62_THAGE|nr:globin family protein [Thalassovita gelatinovora]QIZ82378.1 hemin receptor [Thalassovita gelatinovora]CUH68451.1 Soluble cytochrome O [Thalassovita gelatinovora]SEQ52459.1 nitric oxide dioxygenase [Thalassovita gelatinovora]
MDDKTITLVQDSFAKVVPIKDAAAEIFYANLFETAPQVKPYFAQADMKDQGAKLMATLGVVVNGLRDLDKIVPVAQQLAIKHVDYGVQAEDYDAVGASLLFTLEKGLGDDFTPEVKDAWGAAYATLSGVMKDTAYSTAPAPEVIAATAPTKPFWKFWA